MSARRLSIERRMTLASAGGAVGAGGAARAEGAAETEAATPLSRGDDADRAAGASVEHAAVNAARAAQRLRVTIRA
jgi:hypothetical protein